MFIRNAADGVSHNCYTMTVSVCLSVRLQVETRSSPCTVLIRPLDDRTDCVRIVFTHLGDLAKAVRLFIASLHSQPLCSQMCSIAILSSISNQLGEMCNEDFSTSGLGVMENVGVGHISSP